MANKQETAQIITVLRAAYPRQKLTSAEYKRMAGAWASLLNDVPFEDLQRAAHQHCNSSRWFPTVAELREIAMDGKMTIEQERAMAERLRISWGCCPTCWMRPCRCQRKLPAQARPQLKAKEADSELA